MINKSENWLADILGRGYQKFIAPENCRWVGEFIGETWRLWRQGSWVFLQCPTYSGKTTFVKGFTNISVCNTLILTNRRANRDQILRDLGVCGNLMFSNFDVKSYQSVELDVSYTPEYLDRYQYIVCDEAHYFYESSLLSPRVNLMLEKLFATKKAIKIMMSATSVQIFEYIKRSLHYRLDNAYASSGLLKYEMAGSNLNLREIVKVDSLDDIVYKIKNTDYRWLVFADSISSGKELTKKIGRDAFFLDSESVESDPKAKNVYEELISNERFSPRVLVTTPLLDNGVNLKDRALKGIVITSDSSIELVQMAGRKRSLDADDKVSIYLTIPIYRKICGRQRKLLQLKEAFQLYHDELLYSPYPNSVHMENTAAGNAYRQAVYYNHATRKYGFNWIGLQYLNDSIAELEVLKNAEDVFEVKKAWLLGAEPPVKKGTPQVAMRETKVQRLLEVLLPYRGQQFLLRSAEWKEFCWEYSKAYWRIFGMDRTNSHRANRSLAFDKINATLKKQRVPVTLTKMRVNGKSAAVLLFSAAEKISVVNEEKDKK